MFALALGGLAVSVGLFYRHVVGGGIAGCGGGGACEELLASRWSQVLGVPVAGLGGLTYVVLLGSLAANLRRLLSPLLGLLVGAAAWFIFVQAVLVGRFCPWCMTLHGIGLLVTALGVWRQAGSGGTARALQGVGGCGGSGAGHVANFRPAAGDPPHRRGWRRRALTAVGDSRPRQWPQGRV